MNQDTINLTVLGLSIAFKPGADMRRVQEAVRLVEELTLGVSGLVLFLIGLFFKELLLTSFDPILAKTMGINVNFYHYLLMGMLTLVSVTAMQSVGTILIVAMLITPAATAYLFTSSLKSMMLLASTLGALTSVLGLFLGYSFNIAAGSSIVLTSTIIFLVSFFLSPKQTVVKKIQFQQQ